MNPKDSIVYRTGQMWKMRLLLGVYLSVAILIGDLLVGEPPWFLPVIVFAVALSGASIVVPLWSVKCPRCRARWFWLSVNKKPSVNWYKWLFSQSSCPKCGYGGGADSGRNFKTPENASGARR